MGWASGEVVGGVQATASPCKVSDSDLLLGGRGGVTLLVKRDASDAPF